MSSFVFCITEKKLRFRLETESQYFSVCLIYFSESVLPTCQPKVMQRVWDRQFMECG